MLARVILLGAAVCLLAGCGTKTPDFQLNDKGGRKNAGYVLSVVGYVRCELGEAVLDQYGTLTPWLDNWSAAIDLSLTVSERSTLEPTAGFTDHLSNHFKRFNDGTEINGSRSQGVGVKASALFDAEHYLKISWNEDFRELMAHQLEFRKARAKRNERSDCRTEGGTPIVGSLKIKEALKAGVLPAIAPGIMSRQDQVTGPLRVIEHRVTFETDVSAGVIPSIKLFNTTAGIDASASRNKKDDLVISMGPVADPTKPSVRRFGPIRQPSRDVLDSNLAAQIAASINAQRAR